MKDTTVLIFILKKISIKVCFNIFIHYFNITFINSEENPVCKSNSIEISRNYNKTSNLNENDKAYLLTDIIFPCNGHIRSISYFQMENSTNISIGIWRPINTYANNLTFQLVYRLISPINTIGLITLNLEKKYYVKSGDIVSFSSSNSVQPCPGLKDSFSSPSVISYNFDYVFY